MYDHIDEEDDPNLLVEVESFKSKKSRDLLIKNQRFKRTLQSGDAATSAQSRSATQTKENSVAENYLKITNDGKTRSYEYEQGKQRQRHEVNSNNREIIAKFFCFQIFCLRLGFPTSAAIDKASSFP